MVSVQVDSRAALMTAIEGRSFTSSDPCVTIVHGLLRYRKVCAGFILILIEDILNRFLILAQRRSVDEKV